MTRGMYRDRRYFEQLAAKAGIAHLRWVKQIIQSPLRLQDPRYRRKLEKHAFFRIQQTIKNDHPFLPAPSKDEVGQGDCQICDVIDGVGPAYPATIKQHHFSLHGIITGPTGSGKSTILTMIGQEIHRGGADPSTGQRQRAAWYFDTDSRQMSAFLAAAEAAGCQDVLSIHVKSMFKLNRWQAPPGVTQQEHTSRVTVLDREIFYLRDFTTNSVRDEAYELYNRQGRFNERHLLEHHYSKKCKFGSRGFMARESLINRRRNVLEYLGSVYDTLRSHDLRALTSHSVVWDLHDLPPDHVALFVGDLMLHLEEVMPVYFKPTVRLVLMIDEFSHVCNINRLRRADLAEPYMLGAFRTFRKRGIDLIIGIQDLLSVPSVILSNITGFWLAFRPADGRSARILAQNMAFNSDQTEFAREMPARQVICRTADYPKPFLGHVGEIDLSVASDEEIAQRREYTQKVLDSLLEPEPESNQLELFYETPTPQQAETLFGYYDLDKRCLDYLQFLAKTANTLLPITELDEADHLSQYMALQLRQQLQDTGPGLIRIHRLSTGKRGGPLSVVEITEAGHHLLDKLRVPSQRPAGHGGIDHSFWQHAIYRWALARGYPAEIEKWQNGKSVDVGIEWDEKKVAVEVALENMQKEMSNLIKDLESGWDQIVFTALSSKELNELKNQIAKRFGTRVLEPDKVAFMKLSTFLDAQKTAEHGQD